MRPMVPHEIVLRPLITEKTLRMAERENSYTFQVRREANKVAWAEVPLWFLLSQSDAVRFSFVIIEDAFEATLCKSLSEEE